MSDEGFVIWLDPGLVTGLASYDMKEDRFLSWQYDQDDLVRRLHGLLEVCDGRMQIGWELYLAAGGPQHGTSKYSQEIIGRVKDFALVHDTELLKPQPSSARKLGGPAMLRRMGWYKPGKPHANDAASHLLSDMIKRRPMPTPIREKLFPGYTPRDSLAT